MAGLHWLQERVCSSGLARTFEIQPDDQLNDRIAIPDRMHLRGVKRHRPPHGATDPIVLGFTEQRSRELLRPPITWMAERLCRGPRSQGHR